MRRIYLGFFIIIISFFITYKVAQGSYSPKQTEGTAISADSNFFAEYVGDVFTVDIRDVDLEEVLRQISRKNGITFFLPPSLAKERVMVRFSNLKLDEGLGKILHHYNRIFIYLEESYPFAGPSITRLTEVRIYPLSYKGRIEGPLIIRPESSEAILKDKVKDEDKVIIIKKRVEQLEEKGEKSIEDLSLDLRDEDRELRMEAIKALAKIDDERVVAPLARAMRDKDPEVKREAEKALKEIEASLKELGKEREEQERIEDDSQNVAEGEEEPPPTEGEKSTLTLGPSSGNAAIVELDNLVPVRGVQFTLNGAKPTKFKLLTTDRTKGFFAKLNQDNGKVILVSLSGNKIAPGTGPIVEVIGDNAGDAKLSEVKIVE